MNISASNTSARSYVKETLPKLKSYIKSHILIGGDFNTPLSPMERFTRQKLNREIKKLTDVMTQMGLTDIYRTFQQNTEEYTFSSWHKPSLKLTTYSLIKQISTDIKKLE